MDYVKPQGVVESMLAGGVYKLNVPPRHLILRGMLAGAYLGIGTSMAVTAAVETGYWIVGSILFPFGPDGGGEQGGDGEREQRRP